MQGHGVRLPANMARNNRDRAKLAHGAGVTENDAIDQAPFDVRECHPPEGLPARSTKYDCRLLLLTTLALHERDKLSGNERESNKDCCQNDSRHCKNNLDVLLGKPWPEPPLGTKH
ncbi:MAG: hypothetical protein RL585_2892, partial [Pseudomonadota bacterium]